MPEVYAFNGFVIDVDKRVLQKNGVNVPVGGRAFALLHALVKQGGGLVEKAELQTRVWGDKPVGDNTLHAQVAILRRLLGETCIINRQGLGYRAVGELRRIDGHMVAQRFAPPAHGELIGRADLLIRVSAFLQTSPLVTLVGAPGVGKSRLAAELAMLARPSFAGGVVVVELAQLRRLSHLPASVAAAAGLARRGDHVTSMLAEHFSRRCVLLVLDNCEHMVGAAAELAVNLIAAAPGLRILATSRESLSIPVERTVAVPPLDLPSQRMTPDAIRASASVRLFLASSRKAGFDQDTPDADLATVAAICRRLDGLPLAIELVASWAPLLGVAAVETRLARAFRPAASAATRGGTLAASFAWSYGLLLEPERMVLRRLSIFPAAFALETGEHVTGFGNVTADEVFSHFSALLRKSLMQPEQGTTPPRYRLLETIRVEAAARLRTAGEVAEVQRRHASYIGTVFEQAVACWNDTHDRTWLARYAPHLENIRAALEYLSDLPNEDDALVALAGASWPLWRELSLRPEGRLRLELARKRITPTTPKHLQARLCFGLGDMVGGREPAAGAHAFTAAAALYREVGDRFGEGQALSGLGYCLAARGSLDASARALAEGLSLLEATGACKALASNHNARALLARRRLHHPDACEAAETAAMFFRLAGAERSEQSVRANLVSLRLAAGQAANAIQEGKALAASLRLTPHTDILCVCLGNLTLALLEAGDLDEALEIARETVPLMQENGLLLMFIDHLALLASLLGRDRAAALLAGYADSARGETGHARLPDEATARDRLAARLKTALPAETLARCLREGRVLTEAQALMLALEA